MVRSKQGRPRYRLAHAADRGLTSQAWAIGARFAHASCGDGLPITAALTNPVIRVVRGADRCMQCMHGKAKLHATLPPWPAAPSPCIRPGRKLHAAMACCAATLLLVVVVPRLIAMQHQHRSHEASGMQRQLVSDTPPLPPNATLLILPGQPASVWAPLVLTLCPEDAPRVIAPCLAEAFNQRWAGAWGGWRRTGGGGIRGRPVLWQAHGLAGGCLGGASCMLAHTYPVIRKQHCRSWALTRLTRPCASSSLLVRLRTPSGARQRARQRASPTPRSWSCPTSR